MANTHRGWFSINLAAGQVIGFDQIPSAIAAGSAIGGAMIAGASAAFPRASMIGTPTFIWDSIVFRFTGAGSGVWSSDPNGTPNASIGIAMFGNDPKPISFPGHVADFRFIAISAGNLNAVFYEGDDLTL